MNALDKPLLTTEEVADILGLKPGTVENWRYKDQGPAAVRIGRAVRYRGEVIREWINDLEKV
jgi:predicted DNA-binding transcriptional regulator AlpA